MKSFHLLVTLSLALGCQDDNGFDKSINEVDYSNYVRFQFRENEIKGDKGYRFNPAEGMLMPGSVEATRRLECDVRLKNPGSDRLAKFIRSHQRFEYIFSNKIDSLFKYAALFPDTAKMNDLICADLKQNKKFNRYFAVLANLKNDTLQSRENFTWTEMMKISSRFFFTWVKADSTLGGYICMGFNGQKELKSAKDFTVLEAVAFEAIFYHLLKEGRPSFAKNFSRIQDSLIVTEKNKHKDLKSYYQAVKLKTYELMEQDMELRKTLTNYYNHNKNNIGFIIN